jgi:hypothetical protein
MKAKKEPQPPAEAQSLRAFLDGLDYKPGRAQQKTPGHRAGAVTIRSLMPASLCHAMAGCQQLDAARYGVDAKRLSG